MDLKNIEEKPTLQEISAYIHNPLFDHFYQFMIEEYKALCKITYSKDVWFRGWNIKFRKAGKALCVIYPRQNEFLVLIVIGRKEKPIVEKVLPTLSVKLQDLYHHTKEGNEQRWLMIPCHHDLYQDVLKLIKIRRETK